ncbi:NPC intracellular cholesterol transporter 2-like [Antedon mediterranea]|uniref:NPC intracellular cholesterol transporter 2-like n=1 Tax=Antedon mediterranea TaxID=105859 RepID=UPI003AF7111D
MHFLYQITFTILLFISFTFSTKVAFKNCPDTKSDVTAVDVVPCPADPCQIKRGSSVALKVTFKELLNATAVQSKVYGYIDGVKVPFPLNNPDACKDSGLKCPLAAAQTYTFNSSLPVKSIYPKIKLVAEWQLVDGNGVQEFCFQVPLQIV